MEKIIDETVEKEYDNCVLCGVVTEEPRSKNIDLRYNYIEGAGQLCRECGSKYSK